MAFFGLFGGKKKQPYTEIKKPPFTGQRPFTSEEVGLGAPQLKTLGEAFLPELMRRARGEGLVGFDPSRRDILRREFLSDFGDYEKDVLNRASAQASGQGLRGGVPLSIQSENARNLARARQSALAGIDVEDLAARREDINRAFYGQPETIQLGSGIQQNRANFDLSEYQASLPDYIMDEGGDDTLSNLLALSGTAAGTYFGGPAGGAAGGRLGGALGKSIANRSLSPRTIQDTIRRGLRPIF